MDMFLKDIHASTVKKENEIKEEKDDPMEISETKIIESPKPTDEEEKRRIIEEEKKNLEREKGKYIKLIKLLVIYVKHVNLYFIF